MSKNKNIIYCYSISLNGTLVINNVQLKVEKWFKAGRNIYKINLELETLNIKLLWTLPQKF